MLYNSAVVCKYFWGWQLAYGEIWDTAYGEETVFETGGHGEQSSLTSTRKKQSEQLVSEVWGPLQSVPVLFGDWSKPESERSGENRVENGSIEDDQPVLGNCGFLELEWVHFCWGYAGQVPPEMHFHLHSLGQIQLQVLLTTPDDMSVHLMPVGRLIIILDEVDDFSNCQTVIFKLYTFHRWVMGCAVVGVERESSRERTHSWGAPVPMERMLEKMLPSLPCCVLSVRKL